MRSSTSERIDSTGVAGPPRGAAAPAVVLAVVSLATLVATSAWAQQAPKRQLEALPVSGPARALPASRVHAVEPSPAHPARVYSATPEGLFASPDGGQSWLPWSVGGTYEEAFSVAVHPTDSDVLVVGRRDGLWQTGDGGRSWIPLAYPTPGPYIPLAVAIAESQPNVIYTATARNGVYRSADGGYRWGDASHGLPEAPVRGRPDEFRTLVVHPKRPDTAYVAHERHGVYRTTDGGASWHPFNKGLPPRAGRPTYPPRLAFDPDDPGRLYLLFGQPIHSGLVRNRLYVTSDPGAWRSVEVDLPANTPVLGLSADRRARALRLWAHDAVWEIPLADKP